MRRLAWLTDLHLNFGTPGHVDRLCRDVRDAGADAALLGGDVGEAPDVEGHLQRSPFPCPALDGVRRIRYAGWVGGVGHGPRGTQKRELR
jgi:hypothetical protein